MIRWGVDIVVLAACVVFIVLQLQPGLLVRNTTPAGGDMGAHHYTWVSGVVTNSSSSSVSRSWQDRREFSSRSTAVP